MRFGVVRKGDVILRELEFANVVVDQVAFIEIVFMDGKPF